MIAYLLKVNIAIALFYAFYKLLLSKDTFFVWRRVTLLAVLAVSVVLPLLGIGEWIQGQKSIQAVAGVYNAVVLPEIKVGLNGVSHDGLRAVNVVVPILYSVVCIALIIRIVIQLVSILNMSRKSEKSEIMGIPVRVVHGNITPFSFFKLMFINPSLHKHNELEEILSHEQAHASQWHSIDVLIGEIACSVLWYNPFVWLLNREIRNNLEYLADNAVVGEGHNVKEYQYHLLGLTYKKAAANLYNNFNVLPLKERIKMMNKKRTKGIGRAKYLLFVPMVAALLIGCNIEDVRAGEKNASEATVERKEPLKAAERMPQFPGGNAALMKWVMDNLTYPADALADKVEGMVFVQFVVKADGGIGDVKIVRKLSPSLDAEAERVIKSLPRFEPGMQEGKPVDVLFTLPISFKIPNK